MNRNASVSTFEAVRDLKHTEDQLTELNNRIRLLQQQEKRYNKHIEMNQRCLQSLDEKRRRVQEESQEKRNRHEETCQKQRKLHDRNKILRELRAQKMHNIREDIYQSRRLECEMAKDTSQRLEKKIEALKQSYLNKNRQKRDLIMLNHEKEKENIKNKEINRTEIIKNSTHKTIEEMVQKKRRREQQILRLRRIEEELFEKCRASNEVVLRLKEEISSRKALETPKSRAKILPYIRTSSKPRNTTQNFYDENSMELTP